MCGSTFESLGEDLRPAAKLVSSWIFLLFFRLRDAADGLKRREKVQPAPANLAQSRSERGFHFAVAASLEFGPLVEGGRRKFGESEADPTAVGLLIPGVPLLRSI